MPRKHRHCSCGHFTDESMRSACARLDIAPSYVDALLRMLSSDEAPLRAAPSLRHLSRDADGHWRWHGTLPPNGTRPQVTERGVRTDIVRYLRAKEFFDFAAVSPGCRLMRIASCDVRSCFNPHHFKEVKLGVHGSSSGVYSLDVSTYMDEWSSRYPKPEHYEFSVARQLDPLHPVCRAGHPTDAWFQRPTHRYRLRCERCRKHYEAWQTARKTAWRAVLGVVADGIIAPRATVAEVMDTICSDPRCVPPGEAPSLPRKPAPDLHALSVALDAATEPEPEESTDGVDPVWRAALEAWVASQPKEEA